ncbi:MAG: hypothetical protein ACI83P_001805 [Janthinobacterium sp.]|jgi:hypothetical protein
MTFDTSYLMCGNHAWRLMPDARSGIAGFIGGCGWNCYLINGAVRVFDVDCCTAIDYSSLSFFDMTALCSRNAI